MTKTINISLIFLACIAFVGCGSQALNKSDYVAMNAVILNSLPVLPGSKIIETYVEAYDEDGGNNKTIGYTTTRTYESTQSREEIVAFYRRELMKKGWILAGGFDRFFIDMRKGAKYFHVLAENGLAIITIDHDCYKGRKDPLC